MAIRDVQELQFLACTVGSLRLKVSHGDAKVTVECTQPSECDLEEPDTSASSTRLSPN